MVVLIVSIMTATAMRHIHTCAGLLGTLRDEAIAAELAASGLERARAAMLAAYEAGEHEALRRGGLALEGEGWSVRVHYRAAGQEYEIVSSGAFGHGSSDLRAIVRSFD